MKKWIIAGLLIILLCIFYCVNCTILNFYLPHVHPEQYQDDLGEFDAEAKFKIMTHRDVMQNFAAYAQTTEQKPTLYRCQKRNWLYVWDWVDYWQYDYWKLPYKKCEPRTN